jgi:sulfoxide reductase heme-binding subunit YedZ
MILRALAATSTDGMMKRLGGRRWRALHRAVYVAAALAVLHHFMQAKVNIAEAVVMGGLFFWLMLYRVAVWRLDAARMRSMLSLLPLALAAALLTALAEYAWYGLATGVDPWRVLQANWLPVAAPRPAAVVLAICAAVALAAPARRLASREPARRAARRSVSARP